MGIETISILLLLLGIIPVILIAGFFSLDYLIKQQYLLFILVAVGVYLGQVFHISEELPIPFTIFQIISILALLAVIFYKAVTRDSTIRITGLEIEGLIFISLIFLLLIFSINITEGLFFAFRILFLCMVVYLGINILTKYDHINRLLIVIAILASILSIIAIRQSLLSPETIIANIRFGGMRIVSRGAATVWDPNIFASLLFLPLSYSTIKFVHSDSLRIKIAYGGLMCILFLGMISTFSRSAWVSVFIVLAIILIYTRKFNLLFYIGIFSIIVVIISPEIRMSIANITNRVAAIFAGSSDDSSRIRMLLAYAAFGMFIDSNLVGVGLRSFSAHSQNYFSTKDSAGVIEQHNEYYAAFAEHGLIGGLLFLFILIRIFIIAKKNIYKPGDLKKIDTVGLSLFCTYVGYLIFYLFYGGASTENNIYITVSMILALNIISNEKEHHEDKQPLAD